MTAKAVMKILAPIIDAPVECDGFCRLASTLLAEHDIDFTIMQGSISVPVIGDLIHFWLSVDGEIIDYRLRMWLGDSALHGYIGKDSDIHKNGEPVIFSSLSPEVFHIISGVKLETFS